MRSRYRWQLVVGFLPVLLLVTPFIIGWVTDELRQIRQYRASDEAFEEAVAEADRSDPNWRWEALQASLPDVPDAENLLLQVPAVKLFLGTTLALRPSGNGHLFDEQVDPPALNQLHDSDEIAELMAHQATFAKAVKLARTLENYPRGRIRFGMARDPFSFPLKHPHDIREIASLIRFEVEKLAVENRPAEAIPLVRSLLRSCDAMNDDFFVISHLIRNAGRSVAYGSIQRLLGLTEPGPELETVLVMLHDSSAKRPFAMAFRGERALSDLQFDFFESQGDSMLRLVEGLSMDGSKRDEERLTPREYRSYFKADRAATLRGFGLLIESFKLPIHEQRRYAEATVANLKRRETPLTNSLLPSMVKLIASEQRTQAHHECARVGIACELFRREHQRWPKSLDEIPKRLLPEIPLDPYDGKPIRYRIMPESVRIYSVGEDGFEETDRATDDDYPITTHQRFEIWNPEKRRRPGLVPRPEQLPFPEKDFDAPEEPKE